MKDSIRVKLETVVERHEEIGTMLSQPEVLADGNKFRDLSQEYSRLQEVSDTYKLYTSAEDDLETAKMMLDEDDAEMIEMAKMEISEAKEKIESLTMKLQVLLLPRDPNDDKNVYIEVRAGTGGDEAAIFAGDLFRMYSRYAEDKGWRVEIVNANHGEHGGYKEVVGRVTGQGAYSQLKFESGVHRVQRVPETEAQGRVHTSACTVAILPEVDDVEEITLNPADLKVDTFRASGAGGQHVNKTDSAIRITHVPTGEVVECQEERSQHKNRAKAMSLLQARLMNAETSKQEAEISENRKLQVGTGDRSERIRTYNYPQGRMTDHRINLTLYKLAEITGGDIDQIIQPLINEHQADLLAQLGE